MKRPLTIIIGLLALSAFAYAPAPTVVSSVTANLLNQYTSRTVPGAVDVPGATLFTNSVTINGVAAARQRDYFWSEAAITNSSSAAWQGITVNSAGSNVTGNVFLPKNPEAFLYDADGNLTNDGRWTFKWDAESRLVSMTSLTNAPSGSRKALLFGYDWQGRRISKTVSNWTGSAWSLVTSNKFLYDGWNLVAELNGTNNAPIRTFLWGSDVSGGDDAGGVGGLLAVRTYGAGAGTNFVAMDGNGNVSALVSASDGRVTANYDYGPFGELVRAEGPMAKGNPFRFSTKYQDDESDQLYYGYRFYNPTTGRWLSRDPIGEEGGANQYGFVGNDGVNGADALGQWNIWNPATYGVANGAGWSTADSFNRFHESASWDGYSADYYRQTVASATGFGFLGDWDRCDPLLNNRWRLAAGRAGTVALMIAAQGVVPGLLPAELAPWAELGFGLKNTYDVASSVGTGLRRISAGDQWGALDVGLGLWGVKAGLSGSFASANKIAAEFRALNGANRLASAEAQMLGMCFVAGTTVAAENGPTPIEKIRVGDRVWAWDEATGEITLKEVRSTMNHFDVELVRVELGDVSIEATTEHPFWVEGEGWTGASHLKRGDVVRTLSGRQCVTSVERYRTEAQVFNLEIADYHTYFVSCAEVLVHNQGNSIVGNPLAAKTAEQLEFQFAPQVEQYTLRAKQSGFYPVMVRGSENPQFITYLEKGDVWKFGTTVNPPPGAGARYSADYLKSIGEHGVKYSTEFLGMEQQAIQLQNMKILNYRLQNGKLPPGNKVVN